MNRRISYVTLVSDMYMLLVFSYIIYGVFFGFDRVGSAIFSIYDIGKNGFIIISIIEIVFSLIMAYLLHKCNYLFVRIILCILCVLKLIYSIINVLHVINPFTLLMIFINFVLLIILLLYRK